jgi:hypothetical protein
MEWHVELSWKLDGNESSEEIADEVMSRCSDWFPAVGITDRLLTISLTINADNLRDAVGFAHKTLREALKVPEISKEPVRVYGLEADDFEAELSSPSLPNLVGIAEIASILRVSRQRASELARSKNFPRPLVHLAAGPVWLASSVDRFAKGWARKPGPPIKEAVSKSFRLFGA